MKLKTRRVKDENFSQIDKVDALHPSPQSTSSSDFRFLNSAATAK